MIVGGYTLDLYCDAPECKGGEYGGVASIFVHGFENGGKSRTHARRRGWTVNMKTRRAICPACGRCKPKNTP